MTHSPISATTIPNLDRRERILALCPQLIPLFQDVVDQAHIPGLAYGVILDGQLVHSHGMGRREMTTTAPVDAETIFRIASMTKSFTALAILQLRDRGQLRLDEAAATYVPELAHLLYPSADSAPITVRQLLTMSAGWPQDDPWADRQIYRPDTDLSALYEGGIPFSNPPGVTFEYSNMGYMVLGRIITNVSGRPAMDFVQQEILTPLGMTQSGWQATDLPASQLAHGYRWEDETWREEALLPCGGDVASFAGLFTTVQDLARWVALFQSAWPPRDDADTGILRRSSLREMQQVGRMVAPRLQEQSLGEAGGVTGGGYGFGLYTLHNGDWESVGHGGGLPGFGSHMRWAPDYGVGVVILANVTYAPVHALCSEALALLVEGASLPKRAPEPDPALLQAQEGVNRLLTVWDDALADQLFADNFFLDLDRARWQERLAHLRAQHGRLQPEGAFVVKNWLRGRWRLQGERGWCTLFVTLAPTQPPRVQHLAIESTLPPTPSLQKIAQQMADLTTTPDRRQLDPLLAPMADGQTIWDRLRLANILCGPCAVKESLAGDGESWAHFHLVGVKATVELRIHLDSQSQLIDAQFGPVQG